MKKKTAAPSQKQSKTSVEIRGIELINQLKSESKHPDRYPHQLVKVSRLQRKLY